MKWFKHMTDAHDSNDLTKVRVRYGADGYAVYWYCLELIAADLGASEKITFELRHDAEVIGHNLKIDSSRVEEMMRFMVSLGLFGQSGGIITCLKLAKYLDKKSTRNTTIHRIIDSASSLSGSVADKPGLSGLDRDIDTDIDTEKAEAYTGRPSLPVCPHQQIVELYHEKLPEKRRHTSWDGVRKENLTNRWRWLLTHNNPKTNAPYFQTTEAGIAWFGKFFDHCRKSKFLMTDCRVFCLEWAVKKANFHKIIEGAYDH